MEEVLKAIEEAKNEIIKRIDLLELAVYKENTLVVNDIFKNTVAASNSLDSKV